MTVHRLERVQFIPRPSSEVFPFFSDARNLERITPSFMSLRILPPLPGIMAAGTEISYQLRLYGWPARWLTRIEAFEPPERFVDIQLTGPYRSWRHTHQFADVENGTEMRDIVEYELPFGPLGELVHVLFVRRSLQRIFDYRRDVIFKIFGTG
jgi:hypothetical protein